MFMELGFGAELDFSPHSTCLLRKKFTNKKKGDFILQESSKVFYPNMNNVDKTNENLNCGGSPH